MINYWIWFRAKLLIDLKFIRMSFLAKDNVRTIILIESVFCTNKCNEAKAEQASPLDRIINLWGTTTTYFSRRFDVYSLRFLHQKSEKKTKRGKPEKKWIQFGVWSQLYMKIYAHGSIETWWIFVRSLNGKKKKNEPFWSSKSSMTMLVKRKRATKK